MTPVRRLVARAAVLGTALLMPVIVGCSLGPGADPSPWGDPAASRSWAFVGSPAFSAGSTTTSVGFDASGTVFVALQEYNGGLYNGRVMWNAGGTWVDLGGPDVSSGGKADSIRLAIDRGGLSYITFRDNFGAVEVKTFDGPSATWVNLGPTLTAAGHSPFLAFDKSNNLYVAFADDTSTPPGRLMVEKWTGSAWSVVGSGPVSPDKVDFVSMGFDGLGRIFAVCQDNNWGNQASAFVLNGSLWSQLGPRGFSQTAVYSPSLAMDLYGNPWVAYMDGGVGERATVMEYTGGAWATVGQRGFTAGWADNLQLAISPSGTPYVAYSDQSLGGAAAVMLLRGTRWLPVGKAGGFSPGAAAYTSLALGPGGKLAVAFQDQANGLATTVMEFR